MFLCYSITNGLCVTDLWDQHKQWFIKETNVVFSYIFTYNVTETYLSEIQRRNDNKRGNDELVRVCEASRCEITDPDTRRSTLHMQTKCSGDRYVS